METLYHYFIMDDRLYDELNWYNIFTDSALKDYELLTTKTYTNIL